MYTLFVKHFLRRWANWKAQEDSLVLLLRRSPPHACWQIKLSPVCTLFTKYPHKSSFARQQEVTSNCSQRFAPLKNKTSQKATKHVYLLQLLVLQPGGTYLYTKEIKVFCICKKV